MGLTLVPADSTLDSGVDAVLVLPDNRRVPIGLKTTSLLTAKGLSEQLKAWSTPGQADTIGVVVADRIIGDAREALREAGWSWLDSRGHLRLAADGLLVDIDVPAATREPRRREPFSGKGGIEVATAMLLDPQRKVAVRALANDIGRAPSSVSDVVAAFREASLISQCESSFR